MRTASPERTARIERELRLALVREEFVLHVQPVVDITTGAVVAAETLVRWQHPRDGLLPPADWLDVAESTSVIHELGYWVLDESCRLAASWAEELGTRAPVVHVNISARQLDSGLLPSQVLECLDRYHLPGHRLVLELTETHLDPLPATLRHDLERLGRRGVRLAADDFGTGYSPLTRLTDLPIEMLKIDRQFVAAMGQDRRARAVVHAVLGLGRALGLEIVAEGVETPAQADDLRHLGCATAQGYLWSPARPADVFLDLTRTSVGSGLCELVAR